MSGADQAVSSYLIPHRDSAKGRLQSSRFRLSLGIKKRGLHPELWVYIPGVPVNPKLRVYTARRTLSPVGTNRK